MVTGTVARMESDEADVDPSVPSAPASPVDWTNRPDASDILPPSTPNRRPWGRIVAGVVIVVALVAGVTYFTTRDSDNGAPSAWDPRILDLVHYVESARGLKFEHPVKSEFLSVDDFKKKVTGHEELTDAEKDEIHHYEGLFRALGLVEGDLDLVKEEEQLSGETVLGEYVPETKTIYIRGNTIATELRPTIVHELTHALQDQRFGLELELKPSGADTAFTALVEADALRIEDDYRDTLSEADRKLVDDAENRAASDADIEDVPPILTELFELPYVLGPPFVDAIIRKNGKSGVDKAFEDKPKTEEQLAEPQAYLLGDEPSKVAAPKLGKGEKKVGDPDDFGMISLLLVLGERLSFPQAWAAVHGWKGDASVTYRSGGKDCIRVRTQLDSRSDTDEFESAVRAWGEGRPTTVNRSGVDTVEFASCDPGSDVTSNTQPGRPRTFDVLALRSQLISTFEDEKLPPAEAACVTDDIIRTHDPAKLLELNTIEDENDPRIRAIQRDVVKSVQNCR